MIDWFPWRLLILQMCILITRAGLLMDQPNEQFLVQEACFNAKCAAGDLCYIAHPLKCNHFIMCSKTDVGDVYAQVMPCAFGTFWKVGENACDSSRLVDCPNDPCLKSNISSYGHGDNNCRTYWECEAGHSSIAKCCTKFHSYDVATKSCVRNDSCSQPCPILHEDTCRGRGVKTLKFPDNNCNTYWNCSGKPHPVCCKDGWGYDKFTGRCVVDPSCVDPCPYTFRDICAKRGVTSYSTNHTNCRVYWKCNEKGLDDPYCCPKGKRYDPIKGSCVLADTAACREQPCPTGFTDVQECHLLPVAGDITHYNNTLVTGNGLIMPCPAGTIFEGCNCIKDPRINPDANACDLPILARPPDLENHGKARYALMMIGNFGQGERGRGNMSAVWDGTTGINIPYFGSQAPWNFYLKIDFQPIKGTKLKQILLSSCHYGANKEPTLELSLRQLDPQRGNLTLKLFPSNEGFFQHDMPYSVDEQYTFILIYDGSKVISILEPKNPTVPPILSSAVVSGSIQIHIGGLRFGYCRHENGLSSFVGYVSEIQVSKCLTPEMKELLYPVTPL